MNKKINKIATWLAAAVFLFALAINVKVTLGDPFSIVSDKVLADGTSGGSNGICRTDIYTHGVFFDCYNGGAHYGTVTTTATCNGFGGGTCSYGMEATTKKCDGTSVTVGEIKTKNCPV